MRYCAVSAECVRMPPLLKNEKLKLPFHNPTPTLLFCKSDVWIFKSVKTIPYSLRPIGHEKRNKHPESNICILIINWLSLLLMLEAGCGLGRWASQYFDSKHAPGRHQKYSGRYSGRNAWKRTDKGTINLHKLPAWMPKSLGWRHSTKVSQMGSGDSIRRRSERQTWIMRHVPHVTGLPVPGYLLLDIFWIFSGFWFSVVSFFCGEVLWIWRRVP